MRTRTSFSGPCGVSLVRGESPASPAFEARLSLGVFLFRKRKTRSSRMAPACKNGARSIIPAGDRRAALAITVLSHEEKHGTQKYLRVTASLPLSRGRAGVGVCNILTSSPRAPRRTPSRTRARRRPRSSGPPSRAARYRPMPPCRGTRGRPSRTYRPAPRA